MICASGMGSLGRQVATTSVCARAGKLKDSLPTQCVDASAARLASVTQMSTPEAIVSEWLRSPEHRAILLSPLYREVGIGLAIGAPGTGEVGATVAADFGTRR